MTTQWSQCSIVPRTQRRRVRGRDVDALPREISRLPLLHLNCESNLLKWCRSMAHDGTENTFESSRRGAERKHVNGREWRIDDLAPSKGFFYSASGEHILFSLWWASFRRSMAFSAFTYSVYLNCENCTEWKTDITVTGHKMLFFGEQTAKMNSSLNSFPVQFLDWHYFLCTFGYLHMAKWKTHYVPIVSVLSSFRIRVPCNHRTSLKSEPNLKDGSPGPETHQF